MAPTIMVCGYGPGISDAVARKFGKEGYRVALIARTAERVLAGAAALEQAGVTAKAFPCDLSEVAAVRALVANVRQALGPIGLVHWNAYAPLARDLATASAEELRGVLDVGVHGLLAAVQEALPDLQSERGAVLVTGGGLALYDEQVDTLAVEWGAMGLAVAKAAQHKLVGLLNKRLAKEGVYVGEVTVRNIIKGTAFDQGGATLEASAVADAFWRLLQERTRPYLDIS